MISLRKSMSDLEHQESLREALAEAYKDAVRAVRDYAVEVEARAAKEHRDRLAAIARIVESLSTPDAITEASTLLRTELSGYQQTASKCLQSLQAQLAATVTALQQLMQSLTSGSVDQQERLNLEMERLRRLAILDDVDQIHAGIGAALSGISACIDEIKKHNQVVVTQLCDEIHTLHMRVESAERAAATDPLTGTLTRREFESKIQRETTSGRTFCLVFAWLSNLKYLQRQCGRRVADDLVVAACQRFSSAIHPRGYIGRRSDDELIAVVPIPKVDAIRLCKDLPAHLKGPYDCVIEGRRKPVLLQVSAGVVEGRPEEPTHKLLERADTLLRAFSNA